MKGNKKITSTNKAITQMQGVLLIAILVIVVVAGVASYYLFFNQPSLTEPIKIAVIGPRTGSVAYEADLFQFKPVELAVKEINDAGGILGQPIQLLEEDTEASADNTVSIATKLALEDKVCFILGPWSSDSSYAIQEVLNKYNVGSMTTSAGAIGITKDKGSSYFFRNYVHAGMESAMMELAVANGVQEMAILSVDTVTGRERTESYQGVLSANNVGNPYTEFYPYAEINFAPYVSRILTSGADAVDLIGPEGSVTSILKALAEAGWDGAIYTSIWSGSQVFLDTAGAYAEGLYGLLPFAPELGQAPKFTAAYEAAYDSTPGTYALASYEGVYLIKNAIEKAQSTDPQMIVDALKSNSWQGEMFTYTFDDTNQAYPNVYAFVVENGQHKLLDGYKYTATGGGDFTISSIPIS